MYFFQFIFTIIVRHLHLKILFKFLYDSFWCECSTTLFGRNAFRKYCRETVFHLYVTTNVFLTISGRRKSLSKRCTGISGHLNELSCEPTKKQIQLTCEFNVDTFPYSQVTSGNVFFWANLADVWSLSCMIPYVSVSCVLLPEKLSALPTLVRFFTGVYSAVAFQLSIC